MQQQTNEKSNKLQTLIIDWNARYPFDRYVRKKYNLVFGSAAHRALNHIDMAVEFCEDLIIKISIDKEEEARWLKQHASALANGENLERRVLKTTTAEEIEDYENLNLDEF